MKIGFDGRFIGEGQTGNGVFSQKLLEGLARVDDENRYTVYMLEDVPFVRQHNFSLKGMPSIHASPFIRFLATFPFELSRHKVDLFHGIYSVPLVTPAKVVLTQVELYWLTDPEMFVGPRHFRNLFGLMTRHSIRRADMIITPTQFIRSRLLDFFPVPEERVRIIPFGYNELFNRRAGPDEIKSVKEKYGIEEDYLLTVANLHPRKNIHRLVEAFHRVRQSRKVPHKLVVVGSLVPYRNWRFEEVLNKVERYRAKGDIIAPGYVPLED